MHLVQISASSRITVVVLFIYFKIYYLNNMNYIFLKGIWVFIIQRKIYAIIHRSSHNHHLIKRYVVFMIKKHVVHSFSEEYLFKKIFTSLMSNILSDPSIASSPFILINVYAKVRNRWSLNKAKVTKSSCH